MDPERATITGKVSRRRIAAGSKSDRVGVTLDDGAGHVFALRRAGGNPFRDGTLEELVGKTITGSGTVSGRSFIMDSWKIDRAGLKG